MSFDLFAGGAPRLRAIPASAPFLETLVAACVDALHAPDDPFALADALILLPNRRAARGLMDAFAQRLGGAALLPAIRPLGDLDDDPDVWGPDSLRYDLPPAIEPLRRRLELASLVRARDAAAGGVDDPARALAYADALCRLLDSASAADAADWSKLPDLVERDLAAHWKLSAQFLEIVTQYWPQRLAADGLTDPGARRSLLLERLAAHWRDAPPQTPVIIAGSTGSVAATRALMRVVAALPKGLVVLPGLDGDLDDAAWAQIGPQHPQFTLKRTLEALGAERCDIAPMALHEEVDEARARRVLVRESLAPAETTADWLTRVAAAGGGEALRQGAAGLHLIEAETEGEEASAIALILRETLETPGASAALITPDAALGRRVAAKLARWNVRPMQTAGAQLCDTQAGALFGALFGLVERPVDPILIATVLKHPLAAIDPDAIAFLEAHVLRGPARYASWESLLTTSGHHAAFVALHAALTPILSLAEEKLSQIAALCDAAAEAAEALCGLRIWSGEDGGASARALQELIAHGAALGQAAPDVLARTARRAFDGVEIPPAFDGDPRIAIMGPLEARLQRRDVIVLGGLNEGVWPAPPPEDPFLSRGMRALLGLPSIDERIGLAAHDFAQLANAPRVFLTRAKRAGSAPSVASRWIWRLEALLRATGGAQDLKQGASPYLEWARALDAPERFAPCAPPQPKPPAAARLKNIRVTGVGTLMRDPYAIYAQSILELPVLDPIGKIAGPAERGTALHKAIERLESSRDAAHLLHLIDDCLARAGFSPEERAADRARLEAAAKAYIAWIEQTDAQGVRAYVERNGRLDLACGVTLRGRADRIHIDVAGEAVVVDFKSGTPPTAKQVKEDFEPQLPLEAAMLARGAFEDTPKARATALTYWKFGGSDPGAIELKLDKSAYEAGESALSALEEQLTAYASPDQPFLSKPRVLSVRAYADYDHLARRKEWADAEGEE